MNEKSLEVLNQYNLDVIRCVRGRGGMIIATDRGEKLLIECTKQDKYYRREDVITRAVSDCGFVRVDTYVKNADGGIISVTAEGERDERRYVLKDAYAGSECNIRNVHDVLDAVTTLAMLHMALDEAASVIAGGECEFTFAREDVADDIKRRTKELRQTGNFLKKKKAKNEYERALAGNVEMFYREALEACEMADSVRVRRCVAAAVESGSLVHGNYTHHNVIMGDVTEHAASEEKGCAAGSMAAKPADVAAGRMASKSADMAADKNFTKCNMGCMGTAVTNFEKCHVGVKVADLYQFMRKVLEKHGWDAELGLKMLDAYRSVRRIDEDEAAVLAVLFMFPEKFYKLANQYRNMNKAWVSPKSVEKLMGCVAANAQRRRFVDMISQTLAQRE